MVTGAPGIQAELIWIVAVPAPVPEVRESSPGRRRRRRGTRPPPSTSADFPLTVTSMGELTTARGFDGNGWPGVRLVRVGPRPVANRDRISPAAAGLEALTSEKSLEWTTAGPSAVIIIVGHDIGTTYRTVNMCPPPFWRLFAGSSVMDAVRSPTAPLNKLFLWPFCPRTPKNAPVPPVIAAFLLPAGGPGGVGIPLLNPKVIMVPTGVIPSLCRISYVSSRIEGQVVSEIAFTPGSGSWAHTNRHSSDRVCAPRGLAIYRHDISIPDDSGPRAQWEQAEQSFRRAIEIDPNSSAAHGHFSRFYYWPLGRIKEAVREARAAVRNDPLSPLAHSELCDVLLTAGRYDEAASQCQNVPADHQWEWGMVCLGRARFGQGRTAEAIQVLSSVKEWGYLAYVYAKSGRQAEAEKLMAEAPILHPDRRGAHQLALVFAGFGDRDHTIERLERLAPAGPVRLGFTLNSPEFAFVRGDPRLKALREKVGLPE